MARSIHDLPDHVTADDIRAHLVRVSQSIMVSEYGESYLEEQLERALKHEATIRNGRHKMPPEERRQKEQSPSTVGEYILDLRMDRTVVRQSTPID
ncbi:hypothetical protein [Pararhizobium sp. LjRoot238]|uniref:hypothetical protein n=1 Tax=Pararhizobium sp. LjRoot238 TaxID=3342293 RepID=UPI003ECF9D68